jgi:TPP-dependent pyruvate/acetoin dehydrogenase alpha subunit
MFDIALFEMKVKEVVEAIKRQEEVNRWLYESIVVLRSIAIKQGFATAEEIEATRAEYAKKFREAHAALHAAESATESNP